MSRGKVLLILACSSLLLMASTSVASASPVLAKQHECLGTVSQSKAERVKNIGQVIQSLARQRLSSSSIWDVLSKNCEIRIVSKPVEGSAPLSTNRDVAIGPTMIVFDASYGIWYAYADWNWITIPGSGETGLGCHSPCNVGGADGIGLAFSRPVVAIDDQVPWVRWTWDDTGYFGSETSYVPSDGNTSGLSFTGQDKLCLSKQGTADCLGTPGQNSYSWHHGYIQMNIDDIGCGTIQAFAKYAHSWSSTSVNGIGIAPWSISVQWSSTQNHWEAVGNPSSSQRPCS